MKMNVSPHKWTWMRLAWVLCTGVSLLVVMSLAPNRVAAQNTIIAADNFDNGSPTGGSYQWTTGSWTYTDGNVVETTNGTARSGMHLRLLRFGRSATRSVNLAAHTSVHLTFWWKANSFDSSDFAVVQVNDGAGWQQVLRVDDGKDDNTYHYADIDLAGFQMIDGFQVRFESGMTDSQTNDYFYIDDLAIVSVSSPPAPSGRWGKFDNFELCPLTGEIDVRPKPPGLMECANVLINSDFEPYGEAAPWVTGAGTMDALTRPDYSCDADGNVGGYNDGNYSLLFKDDDEWSFPYYTRNPWAYQEFTVPLFVTSTENVQVSLNVSMFYVVPPARNTTLPVGSGARTDGRVEDVLEAFIQGTDGTTLSGRAPLAFGNATPRDAFTKTTADLAPLFSGGMEEFKTYAGQRLRLRIEANNDDALGDSRFYIDQVRCEVCYRVKEPDPEPGKVRKLSGLAEVLLPSGVKAQFQGIDVWAIQMQTGDPPSPALNELDFQATYTIQDSTYGFYNLTPGKYRVYAEFWYGGNLFSASVIVDNLVDGEDRTLPNLLLIGVGTR
ncbi:MAG: hypothetical protein JW934_24510 [Anaerolineae bacterium]|nr:hypothetical protein [Anaerolineae bacterium]